MPKDAGSVPYQMWGWGLVRARLGTRLKSRILRR